MGTGPKAGDRGWRAERFKGRARRRDLRMSAAWYWSTWFQLRVVSHASYRLALRPSKRWILAADT